MKKKVAKRIGILVCILVVAWISMGIIDFFRVHAFEKPFFVIAKVTADDGGSGTYKGLGYAAEIQGNFMPQDEFPGVTHYRYYVFGKLLREGLRD